MRAISLCQLVNALLVIIGLLFHSVQSAPVEQQQIILSTQSSTGSRRTLTHLEDLSIKNLKFGLENDYWTSEDLVLAYLERIELFKDINTVISLNPFALKLAKEQDEIRKNKGDEVDKPLFGIPFMVKDNIAIPSESGPTTAGSYALLNSTVISPSVVVDKLLAAGAILLGSNNLDEFAQAKGDHPWGWSARGGQLKSIFGNSTATYFDEALAQGFGDVCGSSGGSALSVALGLTAFSIGTQTGVSIECPAARAGVVGFKPGRGGMTSMKGVVPISRHLDVVGPIARTVEDAELVWKVIKHPKGWTDEEEDEIRYEENFPFVEIQQEKISKIRVGVPRDVFWDELSEEMPHITLAMDVFLNRLSKDSRFRIIDKEVVNITAMNSNSTRRALSIITTQELKLGINHYLTTWTTKDSPIKSLRDIIEFNLANPELELPIGPEKVFSHPPESDSSYSDQSNLLNADRIEVIGWLNSSYVEAKLEVERVGWKDGFERYFMGEGEEIDIMIIPTEGLSGTMASLARVPQITIPLSYYPSSYNIESNATWPLYPYPSMPFGLSILASRGHDSHEYLLQVAKLIEELINEDKTLGRRRDWMRSNVRERLEAWDEKVGLEF